MEKHIIIEGIEYDAALIETAEKAVAKNSNGKIYWFGAGFFQFQYYFCQPQAKRRVISLMVGIHRNERS